MSKVFFDEMNIPTPDINLNIGGGTHGENTGRMIEQIEKQLIKKDPDWVVLFGDTDSTLAGAISATKLHIPIAHVEAGLRSWNRLMPEETNRILTDHCSDILFCPSEAAKHNLESEGIKGDRIIPTGDIMYDVALYVKDRLDSENGVLNEYKVASKKYVLATIHRAENTNDRTALESIIHCLNMIKQDVILPLHPRTEKALNKYALALPSHVKPIKPVGYKEMLVLEKNAFFIVTDSGGVQKEAYFHEVPCITLRNETEWVELVDAGVNFLVGSKTDRFEEALQKILTCEFDFSDNLYGTGTSAEKMVDSLIKRMS
jgi:UDP-GlcNAc3NAcA epimerase